MFAFPIIFGQHVAFVKRKLVEIRVLN